MIYEERFMQPDGTVVSFSREKLLGRGNFGCAFYGKVKLQDSTWDITIKWLTYNARCEEEITCFSQLKQETLDKLVALCHKHVIRYFAIYLRQPTSPYETLTPVIITEYINGRTLEGYLEANEPVEDIEKISKQTLGGLSYLHSNNIVHTDLKPANILVHNGEVKICDFDDPIFLSTSAKKPVDRHRWIASARYISPEMAANFSGKPRRAIGSPTDIWSYGCIVLDLVRRVKAERFVRLDKHGVRIDFQWENGHELEIINFISDGGTPEIPTNADPELREFASMCLENDSSKRSSAQQLLSSAFLVHKPSIVSPSVSEKKLPCSAGNGHYVAGHPEYFKDLQTCVMKKPRYISLNDHANTSLPTPWISSTSSAGRIAMRENHQIQL